MSNKVARMVAMLELIPAPPRKISVSKLLSYLEGLGYSVTERTIQRDLHSLSETFPLVLDDRNKPYGWSRNSSTAAGIPTFNPYEALTLVMVSEQFSDSLPQGLRNYLKPKVLEARFELNRHKENCLQHWPEKVAYVGKGFQLLTANIDPETMDVVYDAVLKEKQLSISHKERDGIHVNALGVVLRDKTVYLVCTFWGYKDIRQLAVHRITNAKLLDKNIKKQVNFSLRDYCESGAMGILKSKGKLSLELKMTKLAAKHLYETAISKDQVIEELDDKHVKITGTVKDCKDFRWWLLGFGWQVEVIQPESLRLEFKLHADKMSGLYNK